MNSTHFGLYWSACCRENRWASRRVNFSIVTEFGRQQSSEGLILPNIDNNYSVKDFIYIVKLTTLS